MPEKGLTGTNTAWHTSSAIDTILYDASRLHFVRDFVDRWHYRPTSHAGTVQSNCPNHPHHLHLLQSDY